jgi:hypothetical protein
MNGNTETWYGLAPDGTELQIEHAKLMEWAFDNEKQFTVGWSHRFELKGQRLVRGPKMIETARSAGWDDLADKLQSFGFVDLDTSTQVT